MRANGIRGFIEEYGAEITAHGERESAGQVLYEIGVQTDTPDDLAQKLEERLEGTDWRVINYAPGTGRPIGYDNETGEELPSDLRVKKNLYNQHAI